MEIKRLDQYAIAKAMAEIRGDSSKRAIRVIINSMSSDDKDYLNAADMLRINSVIKYRPVDLEKTAKKYLKRKNECSSPYDVKFFVRWKGEADVVRLAEDAGTEIVFQ